jgi:prolyl 4-hydroxylase
MSNSTVPENHLLSAFMRGAVGGVSPEQLKRTFKENHGWTDEDIKHAISLCRFKQKPDRVDYADFYNLPITRKAKRIPYPFTQIYTATDFLTRGECKNLIAIIDKNLRPSTVSDPKDSCVVSDYRTSKTADLHYFDDPFYLGIDRKIADLLGLSPFLGETMQAQRYGPGQYYKEHWDFFSPTTKEYKVYCDWMGQRTWTTMIYLNDVEEGGETYFKHLKLRVKPKQGMLVAWNNLYKNGIPNPKTMHEACPPISGNKYVITKWWRSWPLI